MAEPKQAALVVLGGPMAGTKCLLEASADNVTVGSDPSCGFCIPLPGVSPIHAWLRVDDSGVTVHDAGSQRGLHINDQSVNDESPLRNGDILWLGTPGENDVVMLQFVLPPRTAAARSPRPATQAPSDETILLGQQPIAPAAEADLPESEFLPEFMPEPGNAFPGLAGEPPRGTRAAEVEETSDAEDGAASAELMEDAVAAAPDLAQAVAEFTEDSELDPGIAPLEQGAQLLDHAAPALGTAAEPESAEFEEEAALAPDSAPDAQTAELSEDSGLPPEIASGPEPVDLMEDAASPPALVQELAASAEFGEPPAVADEFLVEDAVPAQPEEVSGYAMASDAEVPALEPVPEFEEQAVRFPADEPPPAEIPAAVPAFFEDETEPTVVGFSRPELSEPPLPPPPPEPDWAPPPERIRVAPPPPPPPPPKPPAAPRPPEPVRAASTPAARPSAPVTTTLPRPRPAAPATTSTPRQKTAPPRAEPRPTPSPARVRPASPLGRYAAFGIGGVAALGALVVLAMRLFSGGQPASEPTPAAPPVTVAAVPVEPTPAPVEAAPEPAPPVDPAPTTVPVEEAVTIVPSPPPLKTAPTPPAAPTPKLASPGPTPSAKKPAPAATAPAPSAEAVRAQRVAAQVASLMQQADGAVAAQRYDSAVAAYDEVLKLEPQNARAQAGRAGAMSARDLARRTFVSGRTVVQAAKAAKGGLEGFESTGVAIKQAPDFLGRIEFEMSPSSVKPGDSYVLKFYLVNEGKKSIKVSGVTATTVVNGDRSGGPVGLRAKEVDPQQRELLGEVGGVWGQSVKSWTAEVLLTANKGDSLRNQLTWR